jgi:hypothetical protein
MTEPFPEATKRSEELNEEIMKGQEGKRSNRRRKIQSKRRNNRKVNRGGRVNEKIEEIEWYRRGRR